MVQTHQRRRRNVIGDSSDREDEDATVNTTPKKQSKLPERHRGDNASPKESPSKRSNASASSTPKKPSRRLQKQSSNETGSRSIESFFKPGPPPKPTPLPVQRTESKEDRTEEEQEDIEEIDDSSEDGLRHPRRTNGGATQPSNPRKRSSDTAANGTLHASQKFRKITNGSHAQPEPAPAVHTVRPWTEQYAPTNLEELAVHKKKVADVRDWLESVYAGRSFKRLLVLKGSAGTGKTCTVSLLAKALGIELVEWANTEAYGASGDAFTSLTAQFGEFILRSRIYSGLQMAGLDGVPLETNVAKRDNGKAPNGKQAILVEEFPNSITRSTDAVHSFRSIVAQYLAANTPGRSIFSTDTSTPTPLIMIISESVLSGNTFGSDNFTAHRLLGQELLTHPGCTVIEFNAVAPTFITKGLNVILQKHSRQTGKRFSLHPQLIQKISELGDIRNAASSLEFLCLQAPIDDTPPALSTSKSRSKSKSKSKSNTSKSSKQQANEDSADPASLSLLNLRESTLGLFHAIGKVVYNKRIESSSSAPSELPQHLSHKDRPCESEVNISALFDTTGTDVNTFLAALHENYILSCNTPAVSPDSEATLDTIIGCLGSLADADILDGGSSLAGSGRGAYAGAESLTQSSLAFEVAVRGLLFSLPYPVKRAQPSSSHGSANAQASRNDAYRMFYPSSLRLWRRVEETTGLLDLMIARARDGTLLPSDGIARARRRFAPSTPAQTAQPVAPSMSQPGRINQPARSVYASPPRGAASFSTTVNLSSDAGGASPPTQQQQQTDVDGLLNRQPAKLGGGESPRVEMLLDRLPYLSLIMRGPASTNPSSTLSPRGKAGEKLKAGSAAARLFKEVDSLTRFQGFGPSVEDEDDEREVDESAPPPTGLGLRLGSGGSSGYANLALRLGGASKNTESQEKTILSDDDIEDSDA